MSFNEHCPIVHAYTRLFADSNAKKYNQFRFFFVFLFFCSSRWFELTHSCLNPDVVSTFYSITKVHVTLQFGGIIKLCITVYSYIEMDYLIRLKYTLVNIYFVYGTVKFRLTAGPQIRPSASYNYFLYPKFYLYKSMVVGSDNTYLRPLLQVPITLYSCFAVH